MALGWPADFPDDCPPEEATPADGIYYYIVKNDPPQPSDFVSLYHRNRRLAERRIRNGIATQCRTMGLSIFAVQNDAIEQAQLTPQIGNKVAMLVLSQNAGSLLYTPRKGDSHHTWWETEDCDPTKLAIVVLNIEI